MGALTKAQMAERLFEEFGLNKREAKEIVETFFEELAQCLERNERVKLSSFGNFDLRDKRARPGRNPLARMRPFRLNATSWTRP
ncbi:MAG: HU family DNA-binding protein, partial [Gammaproteobacteria bacterium]|nr:HU family DNA-binding protein [Gammaproteobacteria bacterium]